MNVYLSGRDDVLLEAWKLFCGPHDFVTVYKQDILFIKTDAVVAPANSFGFMTGGIDLHYKNYLGQSIEDDLQKKIIFDFNGELLVGQATSVEVVPHPTIDIKYVIAAPTMRVPEKITHTINVYLATKAALIEALNLCVESITFPGMGTGTGQVSPMDCAKQMSAAIKDVLITKRIYNLSKSIYDEQSHMLQNIVTTDWFKVQTM